MRAALWIGAAALMIAPETAAAGAWLQDPGTAYTRVTVGYLSTDQRYDENGDPRPFLAGGGFRDVGYTDVDVAVYTELGLHPRWNLVAYVPWKHVQAEQPAAVFDTWGFSDLSIGVKTLLGKWDSGVASAMGALVFPLGYDPDEYPSLGSSVNEAHLGLQAGMSNARLWANAEGWFRVRGGDFRNQVAGALTGGAGGSRVGVRAEARGEIPVGSGESSSGTPRFDPNLADPSILDLAATLSVRVTRLLAVEAEARSTVWGKNTLDGTRFYLALATGEGLRLWGSGP